MRGKTAKRLWFGLALGLLAPGTAARAETGLATLTIRVLNAAPEGGMMRLGLYDAATYPDDNSTPVASADVKAEGGETVITLRNVVPGTYAIEVYQDINSNGKMDTNWIGFPREPFGFSRDAKPRFSKPDFSAVKFALGPGESSQILHLQNLFSFFTSK